MRAEQTALGYDPHADSIHEVMADDTDGFAVPPADEEDADNDATTDHSSDHHDRDNHNNRRRRRIDLFPMDYDPRYRRPQDADVLAKKGSIWHRLSSVYRNAPIDLLLATGPLEDPHGTNDAMCLISAVYTRNCKYLDESFEECILRRRGKNDEGGEGRGFFAMHSVMTARCRRSEYWIALSKRLTIVAERAANRLAYEHLLTPPPPLPNYNSEGVAPRRGEGTIAVEPIKN